jgi:hypothetical protein
MFHITRGRALVSVTELGGLRGGLRALAGLAILAAGIALACSRTARETAYVLAVSMFAAIATAVVVMTTLLSLRIIRELRGSGQVRVDVDRPELAGGEPAAVEPGPAAVWTPADPWAVEPTAPAWPDSPAMRGQA